MCEFTQREYNCGHFRFIAARWCNSYKVSHRRCTPDVTRFEFWQHKICGLCQPSEMPPWFHSVKARAAPAPAPLSAPVVAPAAAAPRRRRSTTSAGVTKSKAKALTAVQKAKPARPPVPLFSATPAVKATE